ncbi:hypothetical protein A2129_02460 [Candidatus Woesebacteria bacterium GWC1_42_13]|uniref:Uncharacterized protein n=2 Tax=Candidatus Woeseibacteriota TaxID=1752722 RepID=A0A1F7WV71_9BACT|nr:MAG: hypothetical protein UT23_C0016G0011 [Candidatus Woesebacteria bacterium GW2011_GWA1_39_12]OGM06722.1 MAG: hypothetical protein A2129_02460 [Candidatus Woesebacteria bacterium GWC1_42_13]
MLPKAIHIHKNRLNNSLNIVLFILPVFVFVLLVAIVYNFYRSNSFGTTSAILGDEAFTAEVWEYNGL